jgi:hypothetical protein
LKTHPRKPRPSGEPRSLEPARQSPEPLVALWQFTWACIVLVVSSRYLWLVGVVGAGR